MAVASHTVGSRNWASLPFDILELISKKLSFCIDYVNFRFVCNPWHSATSAMRFSPLLLFPFDSISNNLPLFSLPNGAIHNIHLIEAPEKVICGFSYGWLFLMDEAGSTSLLNPLTRDQIQLPRVTEEHAVASGLDVQRDGNRYIERLPGGFVSPINLMQMQRTFIKKAVFSNPSMGNNTCIVLAILGDSKYVALCKPGDKKWTFIGSGLEESIEKAVYCNRRFYLVDRHRRLSVCSTNPPMYAREVLSLKLPFQYISNNYYFFQSNRVLMLVFVLQNPNLPDKVKVFRADIWQRPWWAPMDTIENYTMFLSSMDSFCVNVEGRFRCSPNTIYFAEPDHFIHNDLDLDPETHHILVLDATSQSTSLVPCHGLVQLESGISWFFPNLSIVIPNLGHEFAYLISLKAGGRDWLYAFRSPVEFGGFEVLFRIFCSYLVHSLLS